MIGAYFKVAQRTRKERVSLEPRVAYLRVTSNPHTREIALEGTELGSVRRQTAVSG